MTQASRKRPPFQPNGLAAAHSPLPASEQEALSDWRATQAPSTTGHFPLSWGLRLDPCTSVRGVGHRRRGQKITPDPPFFVFTLAFDEHRTKDALPRRFSDIPTLENIYILISRCIIKNVLLPFQFWVRCCVCGDCSTPFTLQNLAHFVSASLGHKNGLTAGSCVLSGPGTHSGDPEK